MPMNRLGLGLGMQRGGGASAHGEVPGDIADLDVQVAYADTDVTWTLSYTPASNADTYEYRGRSYYTGEEMWSDWTAATALPSNEITTSRIGDGSPQQVEIQVRGVNGVGAGNWSNVAEFSYDTVSTEPPVIPQVTDLVVIFTNATTAQANFTPVENADSYWLDISGQPTIESYQPGDPIPGLDQYTSYDFQVIGYNVEHDSFGTYSEVFSYVAPVLGPTDQLNAYIDLDIDNVDPDERDDESFGALILACQEWFNIVGVSASAPDSHIGQWDGLVDAYGEDMQPLLTHSPFPERFKTPTALKAMGVQGAQTDAPARGYWIVGDGASYNAPHAAAQALITAAQTYGNPTGADHQKLWVLIGGGFTTLAQAAYEAIQLGQLPDFFSRIRVVGQPNYNSWWAPNAWNYLTANCWPSAGVSGMFGDWWLLAGYYQWHAFNRNNGTTDTTFWNDKVVPRGAMGAFLEAERAGSSFPQLYFRAGDAGIFQWLMSARLLGDFSPENTSNWCGSYRTYVNELWAAQTFGYGAVSGIGTSTANPTHTWHNPHAWAPELTVNNNTDKPIAAVNISAWYEVAGEALERYSATGATTTSNLYMEGGRSTVFKLTVADDTVNEDVDAVYSLSFVGAAIVDPITVTFAETDGGSMSTTLAADLAAISQTGVTAAGNTLIIGPTATSPVAFTRTPDDTIDGARSYTLEISAVSAGGFSPLSTTVEIMDVGLGLDPYLICEYRLNETAGSANEVVADSTANAYDGFRGTSSGHSTGNPDWVTAGLDFIGTGDVVLIPHQADFDISSFVLVVAATHDSVSGIRQLFVNWDVPAGVTPVFAFRSNGTELQFLGRGATPITVATSGLGLGTGTPHLFVAKVDGLDVEIRLDGVTVATGTLTNVVPTNGTNRLALGARINTSPVEGFDGRMHYAAMYQQVDDSLVEAIEQRAVDFVLADQGVTITLG
jgi:hypothetical protein